MASRSEQQGFLTARRTPSSVQTTHFKAFWVRPVETRVLAPGLAQVKPDLVQTVIPKRLLKKAVDRNGLRRIIREAVRGRGEAWAPRAASERPTPRVVLTSPKGFVQLPSRRELKLQWREELDRLLNLLETKLRTTL